MTLRPLGSSILFVFLDNTSGKQGSFSERTRSGLIIPTLQTTQRGERWGKVIAVGQAAADVLPGDFILIEPLMWTMHGTVNGEKFWKTNTDKVMAVTNTESETVPY